MSHYFQLSSLLNSGGKSKNKDVVSRVINILNSPKIELLEGYSPSGKRNLVLHYRLFSLKVKGSKASVTGNGIEKEIYFNPFGVTIDTVFGGKYSNFGEDYLSVFYKDIKSCLFSNEEIMESLAINAGKQRIAGALL